MRNIRILVTGSRLWADTEQLEHALDEYTAGYTAVTIRHGQCPPRNQREQVVQWEYAATRPELGPFLGADWLADQYALRRGWTIERYPADWDRFGTAAASIRNRLMCVTHPRPNLVIAFPLGSGSSGTRNCMVHAGRAEIRTVDVTAPAGLW